MCQLYKGELWICDTALVSTSWVYRQNKDEIEWFPGPDAQVRPGDLGLLIRALRVNDGSTTSTVTNKDLKKFMDPNMFTNAAGADTTSEFHCFYRNTEQAPVAHLTKIDEKLDQTALNQALVTWGIRVLLVHRQDGTYETPGCFGLTPNHGDWVYFSDPVPANEADEVDTAKAMTALKQALGGGGHTDITENDDPLAAGTLTGLTLEFDCIEFPNHNAPVSVVDMRSTFGLDVLGIHRDNAIDVEWFPQQDAQSRAGDLGLLIRAPRNDGSTKSTVTREVLQEFMEPDKFANKIAYPQRIGVRRCSQLSRTIVQRCKCERTNCTGTPQYQGRWN